MHRQTQLSRSWNRSKYEMLIDVALLLAKIVQPTKCKKNSLAALPTSVPHNALYKDQAATSVECVNPDTTLSLSQLHPRVALVIAPPRVHMQCLSHHWDGLECFDDWEAEQR